MRAGAVVSAAAWRPSRSCSPHQAARNPSAPHQRHTCRGAALGNGSPRSWPDAFVKKHSDGSSPEGNLFETTAMYCSVILSHDTIRGMRLLQLGDFHVYRPHELAEEAFFYSAHRALAHLRLPEVTGEREVIERGLDAYFTYCEETFHRALALLASRQLVEFALGQLATWLQVRHAGISNGLDSAEQQQYRRWGSEAQLGLQFVVEGIAKMYEVKESAALRENETSDLLDELMIAAEEMSRTSALITAATSLFPGRSTLKISWGSGNLGFDVVPTDPQEDRRWRDFMTRGALRQDGDLAKLEEPAPIDRVIDHFGPVFASEQGLSLRDMLSVAGHADRSCNPGKAAFDVKFCNEHRLYETVAHNSQLPISKVKLVLSGLTLTKGALDGEDRELWRPKQHNRLLRRPFVRLGHPTGSHLCWHSANIERSLPFLTQELCSGRVPMEWTTPAIETEARVFASLLDHEWEQTVFDTVRQYGLEGDIRVKKLLTRDGSTLRVPPSVGEIDLLVYEAARKTVYLLEVKRVQPTYVPSQFRDDVSKFFGTGAYIERLKRKAQWAETNVSAIVEHLALKGIRGIGEALDIRLQSAIITKYESFAQVPPSGVRIISLRRLVEERLQSGAWLIG